MILYPEHEPAMPFSVQIYTVFACSDLCIVNFCWGWGIFYRSTPKELSVWGTPTAGWVPQNRKWHAKNNWRRQTYINSYKEENGHT